MPNISTFEHGSKAFLQMSIFGLVFFVSGLFGEVPDKEILENEQLWAQCSEPCYFFIYIKLVISSLQIWRVLFYHSIYCLLMIHSKFLCLLMVFLNAYLPPNCT